MLRITAFRGGAFAGSAISGSLTWPSPPRRLPAAPVSCIISETFIVNATLG